MGDNPMAGAQNKLCIHSERRISAQCSCTQCDSLFCFAKRHICAICTCENCGINKNCNIIKKRVKESRSDYVTTVYLNPAKSVILNKEPRTQELTENDKNYESDRIAVIKKNLPPPKSVDEYIDRLLCKTKSSSKFKRKPSSLSGYIDAISENARFKSKQDALDKYIRNLKETKRPVVSNVPKSLASNVPKSLARSEKAEDRNCRSELSGVTKDKCSRLCKGHCKGRCRDKIVTQIRSVMLSCPLMDLNSQTVSNKTHVIKVPCENFNDSDSCKNSELSTCKNNSFLKYNIFKKLKDAYNACSCKICECMPTKTVKDETCSCTPCECVVCKSYTASERLSILAKQSHGVSFTSSQYGKDYLQKEKQECFCEPCECLVCKDLDFGKKCGSNGCQYIECKPTTTRKSLVIASVENTACQCSPCECIECVQGCPVASRSWLNVLSADKSDEPVGNDKQYHNNTTASILNEIYYHGNERRTSNEQDVITMYAGLPHMYPNFACTSIQPKFCSCEECECITCVCKEDTFNAIKSSRLFSCDKMKSTFNTYAPSLSKQNTDSICSCRTCQCRVCSNSKIKTAPHIYRPSMQQFSCQRDNYSYLNCCSKKTFGCSCRCGSCRCDNDRFGEGFVHVRPYSTKAYPIKKGEVLTPASHQTKVNRTDRDDLSTTFSLYKSGSIQKSSNTKYPLDEVKYHLKFRNNYSAKSKRYLVDDGTTLTRSFEKRDVLKCDAYVQCNNLNKEKPLLKNNYTDKISGSRSTLYSSTESTRKTWLCKENDNAISGDKSWESSCNSSGHDHPDYLIRFPKLEVENYLEDILRSDLRNDLKSDPLKSTPETRNIESENQFYFHRSDNNVAEDLISATTSTDAKESENTQDYLKINIKELKKTNQNIPPKFDDTKKNVNNNLNNNLTTNKNYDTKEQRKPSINNFKYTKPVKCCLSTNSAQFKDNKFRRNNIAQYGKCFHLIENFHQSNITGNLPNYNALINEKTPESLRQGEHWSRPDGTSQTRIDNNGDSFNIEQDYYARVQRTLKDAKEFSLYLLRLLETYEKANKEFERVSDRFKITSTSGSSREFTRKEESSALKLNFSKIIDEEISSLRKITTENVDSSIDSNLEQKSEDVILENVHDYTTILRKPELASFSKAILNHESSNADNEMPNRLNALNSRVLEDKNYNIACYDNMINNEKSNDITSVKYDAKPFICKKNVPKNEDAKKDEKLRKYCKKYSKFMKRTNVSKRMCLKKPNWHYSPPVESPVQESEMSDEQSNLSKDNESIQTGQICNQNLDALFDNAEELSIGTSTYTSSEREILDQGIEKPKTWSVEKNKISVDTRPACSGRMNKEDRVCIYPSLGVGMEEAVLSISLQTHSTNTFNSEIANHTNKLEQMSRPKISNHVGRATLFANKEVWCSDVLFLNELKKQIRDQLKVACIGPLMKKQLSIDNNESDFNSFTSHGSCEEQKVRFLVVRKVSDHTALVKWEQPRELTDVQGYELLVDGRAVQKIFNPTKCMAAVTCLPHTDRILLTIRTITSIMSDAGHYPASTIIYRPRLK